MVLVLPRSFADTLAEAQAGSGAALSCLYREFQPAVIAYFRHRAPQDADDLCSEVWLDVHRNLGRFSGDEDGFRRWVFTIARRRLIDDRRRAQRRRTSPLVGFDEFAGDQDPEAEAVSAIVAAEVCGMVERLPAEQAAVVRLRLVDGLSVEETATRLGKRPGAVRVLHHRGLRRLATLVASTAGVLVLTAALAVAQVLPDPVQRAAHDVLDRIGIHVPDAPAAPAGNGSDEPAIESGAGGARSTYERVSPEASVDPAAVPASPPVAGTPPVDPLPETPAAGSRNGHGGPGSGSPPEKPGSGNGNALGRQDLGPGPGNAPPVPPGLESLPPGQDGIPPGQAKKN